MGSVINSYIEDARAADKLNISNLTAVQDIIPGGEMHPNGILELGGKLFSKMYRFEDINFITEGFQNQDHIFNQFVKILESVALYRINITIINHPVSDEEIKESVFIKNKNDGLNHIRDMYNEVISEKIKSVNDGLIQDKYLTCTIYATNYTDASQKFARQETALKIAFSKLISDQAGSQLEPLDADERIAILYDFYHMFDKSKIELPKFDSLIKERRSWKDVIVPDYIKFKESGFETDTCIGAAYSMSNKYPSEGVLLWNITNISVPSMVSISIKPLETGQIEKALSNKLGIMQMKDSDAEKKASRQGTTYAGSFARNSKINDVLDVMECHRARNDQFFLCSATAVLISDREEKLKKASANFISATKNSGCAFKVIKTKQLECLNSALPYGPYYLDGARFCNSFTAGCFIPFEAINIQEPGGCFLGINMSSQKVIIGNRRKNKNGNGIVLGSPGSGKSTISKVELGSAFLNNDDVMVIICDPQGEYTEIAKTFNGSTVAFSEDAGMHINPLDIDFGRCEHEYTYYKPQVQEKKAFILSIFETTLARSEESLSMEQRSIINQVADNMYIDNYNARKRLFAPEKNVDERYTTPDWMKGDENLVKFKVGENLTDEEIMWENSPTFSDFNKILKLRDDYAADALKNLLDTFISGELSIFNNRTNVNVNNRFLTYCLQSVDEQLRPLAMLVMLSKIGSQIEQNSKEGIVTLLYIDEFHEILSTAESSNFVIKLWKKVRKLGGVCTGITQNVSDICKSQDSSKATIFSNSEFVLIMGQSEDDIELLKKKLPDITDDQFQFALNSSPGKGLIRLRPGIVVPFDMTLEKDSNLYNLYNTNFFEKSKGRR